MSSPESQPDFNPEQKPEIEKSETPYEIVRDAVESEFTRQPGRIEAAGDDLVSLRYKSRKGLDVEINKSQRENDYFSIEVQSKGRKISVLGHQRMGEDFLALDSTTEIQKLAHNIKQIPYRRMMTWRGRQLGRPESGVKYGLGGNRAGSASRPDEAGALEIAELIRS